LSTAAVSSSQALSVPNTLHVLLRGLVDYAGLFPPAGLSMEQAVGNYARYRSRPEVFALGRFITPAVRLPEFLDAFDALGKQSGSWRISALLGTEPDEDLAAVTAFNQRNEGSAIIDAVEVKVATETEIARLSEFLPSNLTCYCEIPMTDPAQLMSAVRQSGMRAKIRTGGLTADAFPAPEFIVAFLHACAVQKLPFKATAGLHHPLRSDHPLTYEPGADRGTMHGFLNFFLAATLAFTGESSERITQMLLSTNRDEFTFGELSVTWRDRSLSLRQISQARADFAISFGSCSFEEPISDLLDLRLLCPAS
jgi:hypothetical protein